MKPKYELADIIRRYGKEFLQAEGLSMQKRKVLRAIKNCRTAVLGGHLQGCSDCGYQQIAYNSCRNRHCPKCQAKQREKWIEARQKQILPVKCFHVVFTIPSELNRLCLRYPKQLYNCLFTSAWKTIEIFAKDPKHLGAKTGMMSILHTWGQSLSLHPHLHCIIPDGGIDTKGHWKQGRGKGKYLFPVKAMSKVYKAVFLKHLRKLESKGEIAHDDFKVLLNNLYSKSWVVYAKRPFSGAHTVIEYLGRYSHKVAISNHRLRAINNHQVRFSYKNYRNNQKSEMVLSAKEFLRRYTMHILPRGFVRIRHFGIYSSRNKVVLEQAKEHLLENKPQQINAIGYPDWKPQNVCLKCKKGTMMDIKIVAPVQNQPP